MKFLTSVALAGLLLVACGSNKPPLTSEASLLLQTQISTARASASNGDAAGAISQLDAVSQQLDRLHQRGLVTDARSRAIAAAIDAVRSALRSGSTTTFPTTGPTTAPSTEAPTVSTESSTTTTPETTTEPSTSTSSPPTSDTTGKGGKGGGNGNGD